MNFILNSARCHAWHWSGCCWTCWPSPSSPSWSGCSPTPPPSRTGASRGDLGQKQKPPCSKVNCPLSRLPWGEESLLREDTDEGLWFFGPAGENNYRVAGVRRHYLPTSVFRTGFLRARTCCPPGEHPPQWEETAGEGDGVVKNVDQGGFVLMPVCYSPYFYVTSICIC